jgi:glycosyltransferase involved in cell wall biosynthesis
MTRIIAILPAYNAAKTLRPFIKSLPKHVFSQIILVDDSSQDDTFKIANSLPIKSFQNPHNLGYGGNMKRCLELALKAKADIVVEIHPDGEYLPDGILPAIAQIKSGSHLVLGNRFHRYPPGMYLWKYLGSRLLTTIDNLLLGTNIPDLHQGFRVYSKKLLKTIPWRQNSQNFNFTLEVILQSLHKRLTISSVPVTTHYTGHKRGAPTLASIKYFFSSFFLILSR